MKWEPVDILVNGVLLIVGVSIILYFWIVVAPTMQG